MKVILILATVLAVALAAPADTYDSRYDDFDAKGLTENKRLLTAYGNCFLGHGPCTPEGKNFRETIPDAIRTKCAKCTPKQKDLIREVVAAFQTDLPEMWAQLVKKEDPKEEYAQSFKEFLNGD